LPHIDEETPDLPRWQSAGLFDSRRRAAPCIITVMNLVVGTMVRFIEPHRPPQVRWGQIGIIVGAEERRTTFGSEVFVRARFGDFITPWIEAWRLERAA
jgi:hypothetical protein